MKPGNTIALYGAVGVAAFVAGYFSQNRVESVKDNLSKLRPVEPPQSVSETNVGAIVSLKAKHDDTFAWYLELARIKTAVDTECFPALLNEIATLETYGSRQVMDMLFSRWIELDGLEALRHCAGLSEIWPIGRLASVWAKSDNYQAGLKAIDRFPDGHNAKAAFLSSFIGSLAEHAPEEALALFKERTPNEHDPGSEVFQGLAKKDRNLALREATNMPNISLRQLAGSEIAKAWAEEDPTGFIEKFSDWPLGNYPNVLETVIRTLTRHDPEATIEFLKREARRSNDRLWRHMIGEWARTNPEQALEFAESSEFRNPDYIFKSLASQLFREDPKLGTRALLGIRDPKTVANIF